MRRAAALGWRLGTRATAHGRLRSVVMLVVAAGGTLAVLAIVAVARAMEAAPVPSASTASTVPGQVLVGAVVLAVVLPVLALAAASGRMSAALRGERLARLHLPGLSRSQLAAVGAGETLPWALGGWAIGLALALVLAPALRGLGARAVGIEPTALSLSAPGLALSLAVPVLIAGGGAIARRGSSATDLSRARGPIVARARLWRLLPLLAGLGALAGCIRLAHRATAPTTTVTGLLLGGAALAALGVVLVPPLAVRLLAGGLVRLRRPAAVIAGRRLQAQPGTLTRIYSALLIALVVSTAAQGLIAVFISVPQYAAVEHGRTVEARAEVYVPEGMDEDALRDRAARAGGVREVAIAVLAETSLPDSSWADPEGRARVLITTCAELEVMQPGLTGCRDDRAAWIGPPWAGRGDPPAGSLELFSADHDTGALGSPIAAVEPSTTALTVARTATSWVDQARGALFVPRSLLAPAELQRFTERTATVTADPRPGLDGQLADLGLRPSSGWDLGEYLQIRHLVDSIAC
ncbi:hypothetical protein BRM3_08035 [Brachybacterium huguangmaarense]|uniref:FtsX-like permease family protein n=1 Tax=Brachybacterium huguangmaarense TaxID=1652028 RepID=A0ABY6FXN3_9MICO|nr:hypothetical protein [Brachybacterium huguangmaarense]UYG15600.1 hypothetical protein BRM3_08035 [Brachybacterium huguangmaarense]